MPPDDIIEIDIETLDLNSPSLVSIAPATSFLSAGNLGLTSAEQEEFDSYQTSNEILGPAAGSVLICPGNQVNTPLDRRCPYYAKCPLRRMGKAPQDKLCPVERKIVEDRFSAWCKELNQDAMNLTESDRSVVADLVWIDVQVQRCVNILSVGEDARLMHTNVTEAMLIDPEEAPIPITYEKVLHIATQRLDQLLVQRRMLLKEWMLTPEQKFKVAKEAGLLKVNDEGDVSVELSAKADILRKIKRPIDL
jgi:hypothetical protein